VERFKITVLWLVPTIMRGLLELSKRINRKKYIKYPPIDVCFLGTAPINLETKISFEELTNIPVIENYGLSETTFISTETIDTRHLRKQGSVGGILPWIDLKDSKEKMTLSSEPIVVKTPSIMVGYVGNKIADDEWFDTKDCGFVDKDKVLILKGRNRDIIKKGGVMLALREIEILAEQSCGAIEASAVSVEHQFYGESYILYVVSDVRIDNCLHKHLSKNKWPDEIISIRELPRTRSGKIDKKKLKKTFK
jgi:acyl-CoA synthetase (AMP-forming)/AMP-acid ligase II